MLLLLLEQNILISRDIKLGGKMNILFFKKLLLVLLYFYHVDNSTIIMDILVSSTIILNLFLINKFKSLEKNKRIPRFI